MLNHFSLTKATIGIVSLGSFSGSGIVLSKKFFNVNNSNKSKHIVKTSLLSEIEVIMVKGKDNSICSVEINGETKVSICKDLKEIDFRNNGKERYVLRGLEEKIKKYSLLYYPKVPKNPLIKGWDCTNLVKKTSINKWEITCER